MLRAIVVFSLITLLAPAAEAKVKTEVFEYKDGNVVLEGFMAWDDAGAAKRPGIMVVHEWFGPNANQRKRAEQLAELGYVAFAVDMYGKTVRPKDHNEAGKISGAFRKDRKQMRARILAALDRLQKHPAVDPTKIGAMGFCFGGTTVIELARSGADIKGVVSFHGGLDSPAPADGKNIKGRVMALHGADDPHVKAEDIAAFQQEMRDAKVDWQMVYFGGAVHSFTVAEAGNDPSKGAAYNPTVEKRAMIMMRDFFAETFGMRK